jgi:hypothetical protein
MGGMMVANEEGRNMLIDENQGSRRKRHNTDIQIEEPSLLDRNSDMKINYNANDLFKSGKYKDGEFTFSKF